MTETVLLKVNHKYGKNTRGKKLPNINCQWQGQALIEKWKFELLPDALHILFAWSTKFLWYNSMLAIPTIFQIYRRCIMKVQQAVDFHLQYHQANSKKKYC